MAIEIVDFPMKNGGSFQFAMLNYQRVRWRIEAMRTGRSAASGHGAKPQQLAFVE